MHSPKETKKYYDKHATRWTDLKSNSFHHQKQFEKFAMLLPNGAKVLDIGCAGGIHVPLFLGIGRHLKYHGIDVSNSFLKIARSRYPQLQFDQADILDENSLPKGKFNGFWAGAVLMHVPHEGWAQMFTNIEGKMKAKAIGYITLPVAHPSGKKVSEDPRHFTLLPEKLQKKEFKQRGWKIIKSGTLDGFTTEAVWRWYLVELPA